MRALIICAIIACSTVPTAAQDASVLKKRFENCVFDEVGVQWKGNPRISPNLATETAFQTCATEEQAITSLLLALQVDPGQIGATISSLKLRVKATVREIMADPSKYRRTHGG